jgi:hypothetical protein
VHPPGSLTCFFSLRCRDKMHISRKRSASAMTSPITDDEDFEYVFYVICFIPSWWCFAVRMVDSPTKRMAPMQRVRFDNAAKSVTPLKSVLKRPEVVLPLWVSSYRQSSAHAFIVATSKNSFSKSAASDEGDDVFGYVSLNILCNALL